MSAQRLSLSLNQTVSLAWMALVFISLPASAQYHAERVIITNANAIQVTGTVNAVTNDTATAAFQTQIGLTQATRSPFGIEYKFSTLIPGDRRLVIENISYTCDGLGVYPTRVQLVYYQVAGTFSPYPAGGQFMFLPTPYSVSNESGVNSTNGNWTGRLYADHQTFFTNSPDLFVLVSSSSQSNPMECGFTLSGYLVSLP